MVGPRGTGLHQELDQSFEQVRLFDEFFSCNMNRHALPETDAEFGHKALGDDL